ncbi:MAG: secondary thiamine-phosphate synthase enzyme YjbQ [Endomicrobia bacterium]|nr:secondary thiamine-phosphate synthase enzyme YjbQ [Endomicrobiia bacterium]
MCIKIYNKEIEIRTTKHIEFIDITDKVLMCIKNFDVREGICYLFVPHTTAAITINENADKDVVNDISSKLNKLIPEHDNFEHIEGNSDAHIKSSLVGVSLSVFITDGELQLGQWQGIYFCEFDGPRCRKLWLRILSE